ncbi:3-hydroxyacyl-CoA dehydrogenase family protein [Arthrobacter wenxiniae]|uniref:3-hydroxyacyl-CoA dehydrogenase family protein n=1 Tax=Arthrobacter wenxiniae TaxID=2713570 RepID=A0A7Y7IDG3_9MICC|nr:3-hydroxyacyl-CoA dehydrogenase family protein [Arthrobacter wenxiniae]NVM93453.1 3-hydroxyacyl-CoA dehydrogenase family protein [Arthrobacter wenxiniae]
MTQTPDAPSQTGAFSPTLPHFVGVLGGGRMGAGIAHGFLMAGCEVLVVERDDDAAAGARTRVEGSVAKSVERGLADGADEVLARLAVSTDYAGFARCGLVVEAVPEIWELKVSALQGVERHLDPAAFLASNTSSLTMSGLAAELARPENFIGLHFFNPVPASTLIEVVVARQTSPDLVATAKGWVAALGKTAVVVNDAPGFASSRLGVMLALEAMRMVEEGVASAEDIDNAMVLGYKHPTGPLRTTDIVGLDVRLGIAEYLAETLGERFAPPQILREKVARGELGRKSGKGFFDWS